MSRLVHLGRQLGAINDALIFPAAAGMALAIVVTGLVG